MMCYVVVWCVEVVDFVLDVVCSGFGFVFVQVEFYFGLGDQWFDWWEVWFGVQFDGQCIGQWIDQFVED